ncbi:MAG: hypothetical protein ABEI58_00120 [Candidatus Nanohaloarchaea archaeon]
MSVFELVRAAKIREDPEKYFHADMDYVKGVTQDIGRDTSILEEIRSEAPRKFENPGADVNERAQRTMSAIFLGSAEYNQLFMLWLPRVSRWVYYFLEPRLHTVGKGLPKTYTDLERLKLPTYSRPRDLEIEGEKPTYYADGIIDQHRITYAVLDLEYYFFVSQEAGLEFEDSFIERAKEETVRYFTGLEDKMSEDVAELQASLFHHVGVWCETIPEEYDIDSFFLRKSSELFKKEAGKLQDLHQ